MIVTLLNASTLTCFQNQLLNSNWKKRQRNDDNSKLDQWSTTSQFSSMVNLSPEITVQRRKFTMSEETSRQTLDNWTNDRWTEVKLQGRERYQANRIKGGNHSSVLSYHDRHVHIWRAVAQHPTRKFIIHLRAQPSFHWIVCLLLTSRKSLLRKVEFQLGQ